MLVISFGVILGNKQLVQASRNFKFKNPSRLRAAVLHSNRNHVPFDKEKVCLRSKASVDKRNGFPRIDGAGHFLGRPFGTQSGPVDQLDRCRVFNVAGAGVPGRHRVPRADKK